MSTSNQIKARCRIIGFSDCGYSILPNELAKSTIEGISGKNAVLQNPYNDKSFFIGYDREYSVMDLYNELRLEFGLRSMKKEDIFIDPFLIRIDGTWLVSLDDFSIKVHDLIDKFQIEGIDAYIVFVFGTGELFRKNGFRFYIPTREGNRHNRPHVHVETADYREGSIDIQTLEQIAGHLKKHEVARVRKILKGKEEMLLRAWNLQTDGINVDINYMLGQTTISA